MRRCIKINEEQCSSLNELWTNFVHKEISAEEMFHKTDEICGMKLNYERVKFKTNSFFMNIYLMRQMNKLWDKFIEKREMEINPKLIEANAMLKRIYQLWGFYFVYFCLYLFSCYLVIVTRSHMYQILNKAIGWICLFTIFRQFLNWVRYNHVFQEDNTSLISRLLEDEDDDWDDYYDDF